MNPEPQQNAHEHALPVGSRADEGRKPYRAPCLLSLGRVNELTGTVGEGGSGGARKRPPA